MISTFYHLAFVSEDNDGCKVAKLDLESGVVSADDEEREEMKEEEGGSGSGGGGGGRGDAVWNSVHRVDRSPGLSFGWDKSVANEKLLSNLKIDRNNIVSIVINTMPGYLSKKKIGQETGEWPRWVRFQKFSQKKFCQ